MQLSKLLDLAVGRQIITPEQRAQLEALSQESPRKDASSAMSNVLFYGGGALALAAMVLLMEATFAMFSWGGAAVLSLLYGVGICLLIHNLKAREGMAVAASVLAVLPVLLTGFFIYAVQNMLGTWEYYEVHDPRVAILLSGMMLSAVFIYRWVNEPLQLLPFLVVVWLMVLEVFGVGNIFILSDAARVVTAFYGLAVLVMSILLEMRSVGTGKDLSFWGYVVSATALLGGLTVLWDGGEGARVIYAMCSGGMFLLGGMLARRVLALFGAAGVGAYILYTVSMFISSLMGAAIVLILLAAGAIWLGVLWYRYEGAVMTRLRAVLPPRMQNLIEQRLRTQL